MNERHEVEHVLRAWFEDGPATMPDRVIDVVAARIGRQPQRRTWRVLRRTPMSPTIKLAAALAAVAVVAVVAVAIVGRPSGPSVGGLASPSPSQSPTSTPELAVGANLGPPGTILRVASFSEAFIFTVPAFPSDPPASTSVEALPGYVGFHSDLWGGVTFHDDQSMPSDMCKPTGGRIADIPATPDAVGRWLESSAGLVVSAPVQMAVDGRTTLRWDATTPKGVCDEHADQPSPWFGAGERHRLYAVPTGTDTILVITWGVDWSEGSEAYLDVVNDATDDLVRSMKFGS